MVTALGVLAPGGSFILKAFTLFEHPTICALYLLGALFEQVHVYKPASSKPGNSETYIIGKGFKASLLSCSPSELCSWAAAQQTCHERAQYAEWLLCCQLPATYAVRSEYVEYVCRYMALIGVCRA